MDGLSNEVLAEVWQYAINFTKLLYWILIQSIQILGKLSPIELAKARNVCARWRSIIDEKVLGSKNRIASRRKKCDILTYLKNIFITLLLMPSDSEELSAIWTELCMYVGNGPDDQGVGLRMNLNKSK